MFSIRRFSNGFEKTVKQVKCLVHLIWLLESDQQLDIAEEVACRVVDLLSEEDQGMWNWIRGLNTIDIRDIQSSLLMYHGLPYSTRGVCVRSWL